MLIYTIGTCPPWTQYQLYFNLQPCDKSSQSYFTIWCIVTTHAWVHIGVIELLSLTHPLFSTSLLPHPVLRWWIGPLIGFNSSLSSIAPPEAAADSYPLQATPLVAQPNTSSWLEPPPTTVFFQNKNEFDW